MRFGTSHDVALSRAQYEVLTFRAPPHPEDGEPQIEQVGGLGEFGGGKTFIAAWRFMLVAAENTGIGSPRDPLPCGISAPTSTGLINGPLAALDEVIWLMTDGEPRRLVLKDRRGLTKDPHILLRNGVKIILYTGRGALDGPNLFQFWADEIQDRSYEGQWVNMSGRARLKGVNRLNAQASGIAQDGYVAEIFRNPPRDGCHLTKLLFPENNADNLAHGYADLLKANMAGGRKRDPDGWMMPEGIFYPAFCKERNINPVQTPREVLHKNPTDISIDLGARAAVTFWQRFPVRCSFGVNGSRMVDGQVCVDQWLPDDMEAEEIAFTIRDRYPWAIVPGVSTIALDPTSTSVQVRYFRQAFPDVQIVMQMKGAFYWHEGNGVQAVEVAVLDRHGNVRLFVHPDLLNDPSNRGIVAAMQGYRRDKPKDKKLEHVADTVRYQIQHRLPLEVPSLMKKRPVDLKKKRKRRPLAPGMGEVVY